MASHRGAGRSSMSCAARPPAWWYPPSWAARPSRRCSWAVASLSPTVPPSARPAARRLPAPCALRPSALGRRSTVPCRSAASACARRPRQRRETSPPDRAPPAGHPRPDRRSRTSGVGISRLDGLRLRDEPDVAHARRADHGKHLDHARIGDPPVGSKVHPGGPFGSHQRAEGRPKVRVGQRGLLDEDPPLPVEGHNEPLLRFERACFHPRQAHVHAPLHDGRGDHEDDEQHEGHVDERRHVDVGVEGQLPVPAQSARATQEARHYSLPSRAMVPMISWANPSSSPANRPRRLTKRLYAITDGTATASPATVVTSASATPGATAPMFPEPPTAIPMKASITPSTVPSRPSSGLTEPNVASQGMNRAAASRSAATSLARTIRNASSCVVVSGTSTCSGPSFSLPGLSSEKKWMPSRSSRLYGEDGSRMAAW